MYYLDVESNRKMLKMLMKKQKIHCEVAENGQLAVDDVMQDLNKYHIVFMDNQMPVLVIFR